MKKYPLVLASALLALSFSLTNTPTRADEGELTMTTPIPFKGVAKLVKRQLVTHQGKTKTLEMRAVYPRFLQSTPVTRLANWKIRTASEKRYADFITQMKKDEAEGFTGLAPYSYDELPELHYYYAPRLVSTAYSYYRYTGGAHGMNATVTTNFGQFAGMAQPKVLTLGDFFTGTTYRKTVEKKLIDKLRANKEQVASWIEEGTVKSFTTYQLNNFVVSPKGLTWYFAPYEVGPYASGEYEVTLPFDQLTPDFKRSVVQSR